MSEAELDLIAAYAVGALDDAEQVEAERLLDAGPALRAALAVHLDTLATLADEVEAPPALLDAILADLPPQAAPQPPIATSALRLNRRSEAPDPEGEDWHHASRPPAMTPSSHVGQVADLDEARRQRAGRLVRTVLAAAAVVALLLVGIGLVARDDGSDQLQDLASAALDDPDARVVDLAVPDTTDTVARAAVLDDGSGYLVVDDLPALESGETYQLWMLPAEGTEPISLGLVDPAANAGTAAFQVAPDAAGVALSREPAGGSVTPTEVVAAGTFT
jgi:anti-sigma-K factor RskA